MSISSTTQAGIRAGLRTAEQVSSMGLGALTLGGTIAGATNFASINWKVLGGALAFIILVALLAGLKSFLSFQVNGIPAAYTPGVSITTLPAAAIIGSIPDVPGVDPAAVDPGIPAAPAVADPAVVTPAQ